MSAGRAPAAGNGRRRVLCRLAEIADGRARGFVIGTGPRRRDIFVVRAGARVYGYANACPHLGTPLDWVPDRFVCAATGLILCATHSARFRIEDGVCVAGTCAGQRLVPIAVALDDQRRVFVREP